MNENSSVRRYKWFLPTKRTPKADNSKSSILKIPLESNRCRAFFSLRERFQQQTSARVNAYGSELVEKITDSAINDDKRLEIRSTITNRGNNAVQIASTRNLSTPHSIQLSQNTNLKVALFSPENVRSVAESLNSIEGKGNEVVRGITKLDSTIKNTREELSQCGWYWGKLNRASAQKRLAQKENGSFLVRDSQTEQYQFTVSFRSSGITLHCRIDYLNNYWSLSGLTSPAKCESLIELIEDAMKKSEYGIIGLVKQNSSLTPPFPVRLLKPINRFYEVTSLQHLCRFTIRQHIGSKDIESLPL